MKYIKCFMICFLILALLLPCTVLAADSSADASGDRAGEELASGELSAYEIESLTVLGNIYGILIFFVVVALCYFTYRFFRMFF